MCTTAHEFFTSGSSRASYVQFRCSCKRRKMYIRLYCTNLVDYIIVGFFISVSSLKVFGHSIHSEWRRIYLGKSIHALQNDTLSYHDYSVSGSSRQHCSGIPLKLLCLFSSIFVQNKNFPVAVGYYLINIELIWLSATKYKPKFSHGLMCHFLLDRLHWCAKQRDRTSVLLASCDIHISPFSINLHFNL